MTEDRTSYFDEYPETEKRSSLKDGRNRPIFIHSVVDDMTFLTPNAKCVYMHLARRADNKRGNAWPSYQSIGDHCFSSVYSHPDTRRRHAISAVDELIEAKLISKTARTRNGIATSNEYELLEVVIPQSQHAVIPQSQHAVIPQSQHAVIPQSQEGTPIEGTPIEGTPKEGRAAREQQPKKAAANPHIQHPAVQAYRDIFDAYPAKAKIKAIAEANPPIEAWVRACRAWRLRPYNPGNIAGILDWTLNPHLIEKSGNATNNMTIRNGKEVSNGQSGESAGYNPEEIAAVRAARKRGDKAEVERILRAANERIEAEAQMPAMRG